MGNYLRNPREFDGWLKANAVLSSMFAIGMLARIKMFSQARAFVWLIIGTFGCLSQFGSTPVGAGAMDRCENLCRDFALHPDVEGCIRR